jgi:hypothetical protein
MTDLHRVRSGDRLAKGDKVKVVLGAILIAATLAGVGELASTAYRTDDAASTAAVIDH